VLLARARGTRLDDVEKERAVCVMRAAVKLSQEESVGGVVSRCTTNHTKFPGTTNEKEKQCTIKKSPP
jgi:hypothetical protein